VRLQGKTALISGGMGPATARQFAAEGVVRSGRLFLLELNGDLIHSLNPDGTLVTHTPESGPAPGWVGCSLRHYLTLTVKLSCLKFPDAKMISTST
jgi:hypothetical protein